MSEPEMRAEEVANLLLIAMQKMNVALIEVTVFDMEQTILVGEKLEISFHEGSIVLEVVPALKPAKKETH